MPSSPRSKSDLHSSAALRARLASRLLSGYLCGTKSGLLGLGRRLRGRMAPKVEEIAALHRDLDACTPGESRELAGERWEPSSEAVALAGALRSALDHRLIIELVVFGSQARGGTTGFSDVDAILVIADEGADDPPALRSLRPHVLAAQRAVLAYQPMQHHGFEVVTPRLLRTGSAALDLPASALSETRSLHGKAVLASLSSGSDRNCDALRALTTQLLSVRSWPTHPWDAHVILAMFELLPVLYLQVRGASTPKWRSFDEARSDFGAAWWPYDVLRDVRLAWLRMRRARLELLASLLRNPWTAVAVWRRLPERLPEPVRPLLTPRLLEGLGSLTSAMHERAK
jgi:hypothetical protein